MANKIEVFLGGTDNLSPVLEKARTGLQGLVGAFALGNIAANAFTTTFHKLTSSITGFAKQAVSYSSRVEELSIVVGNVGKIAGYSADSIDYFVNSVKSAGISTAEATTVITKMIQNNLDLTKSFDLARMSQDAATIAGVDSSEALERIIHGIVTLQPEVLRNMGIMVSLEREYDKFAKTLDRTSKDLSPYQKQQVAMNAVLAQATAISGNYTSAMDTSSKQLRSFTRYMKEIYEALGTLVLPVYHDIIFGLKDLFAEVRDWLEKHKSDLQAWSKQITQTTKDLKNLITELRNLAGLADPLYRLGRAITGTLFNNDLIRILQATYKSLVTVAHGFNILWYGAQGNLSRARREFEMMMKSAQESEAILKKIFLLPQKPLPAPKAPAEVKKTDPKARALAEAKAIQDRKQAEDAAEVKAEADAKAAEKRLADQAKLQEETTEKIMELTADEADFKIWKVDEAYKKEQALAKGNKELLAQLEVAYNLELTKIATEHIEKEIEEEEKYGEWFHENQMKQIEDAKQSIEIRLAAYQELYSDLKEVGVNDYEFTKELIEKKKKAFIEAGVDIVDAEKWAAAENQKAWEDWALRFGSLMDGIRVYFARAAREQYNVAQAGMAIAQTGMDAIKSIGGSFEEMSTDLFSNKLKSFADYWTAFWTQMAQIAAKLIRGYIEQAIYSAIGQASQATGGGGNILGALAKGAISWFGSLFGGGAAPAYSPTTGGQFATMQHVSWSGGQFATMQHGGIITQPTMALMGEAGPEAVIPLDKLGGANINIFHIVANDAASFTEMCRRSPGGIVRIVHETLKEGGALRGSLLEAIS